MRQNFEDVCDVQNGSAQSALPKSADAGTFPYPAGLVLAEVSVASLIVVGMFDAASQPWSWTGLTQFAICASLGVLLWLADGKLHPVDAG
jgi:hypothetical protein